MYRALALSALLLMLVIGCSQASNTGTKKAEPKVDKIEMVEISVEQAIESAVNRDKSDLEEAHKRGKTTVVGLVTGKEWLAMNLLERIRYLKGVADVNAFSSGIDLSAFSELESQRTFRGLEHTMGDVSSYQAGQLVVGQFSARISEVISGRTYGDLHDAVTRFYANKPLLKDRPVLWVLTVPLFKELQESRPKPAKGSVDEVLAKTKETVHVGLVRKSQ